MPIINVQPGSLSYPVCPLLKYNLDHSVQQYAYQVQLKEYPDIQSFNVKFADCFTQSSSVSTIVFIPTQNVIVCL